MAANYAAQKYLEERGIEWHHAMKHLLPDLFFSNWVFEKITLDEIETLVELIAAISLLIRKNYTIAWYHTIDKDGVIKTGGFV